MLGRRIGVRCGAWHPASLGDIWGTRKRQNGDAGKLLTDARETSYVIQSSLLTDECSTVEQPGNSLIF